MTQWNQWQHVQNVSAVKANLDVQQKSCLWIRMEWPLIKKETLKELMNLHPAEVPPRETDDYSSYAYQYKKASVFKKSQSFSNFTAAGPSKMYPGQHLHVVTCAVLNQSKKSISGMTKVLNLASRGQLPSFVVPTFCSALPTALKKTR